MAVRSACAAVLAALVLAPNGDAQPLRTALMDPDAFAGPESALAFSRAAAAGATSVRLVLRWSLVARSRPGGNAADPSNPAYDWNSFDVQVDRARAAGLDPIVCIATAPPWATDAAAAGGRTNWPKPDELALFAAAASRRYAAAGIHIWQVWNEPNGRSHLNPQYVRGRPVAARQYRRMVAAFANAVHGVDTRFTVVAGALAPFGHHSRDIQVVAPLRFMRELLCVSRSGARTCRTRVPFDVWAHNPYTNGGPSHHAAAADDVSIGDLPEMRRVLVAAERAGNAVSRRTIEFWVSEFAWDTKPSDPQAVPLALHSRWVAEALYRMWTAGVSLVTWWRLRDDPLSRTPYQSGLWFRGGDTLTADRPKRSLTAFRFPFVAFRSSRGVSVWGRAPGAATRVVIERSGGARWQAIAVLSPNRDRIFRARLPVARTGALRARVEGAADASLPFSLEPPPTMRVFPFGCGGSIRCSPRR
jgi:hypothetical protein